MVVEDSKTTWCTYINMYYTHVAEVVLLDLGLDEGGTSVPSRLHAMYGSLARFCKAHRIDLHITDLTRNNLSFEAACDFPTGILSSNLFPRTL